MRTTGTALAGWVFADALLALTIVGLASGTVVTLTPPAAAETTEAGAPATSSAPVLEPSPPPATPMAVAVEQTPVVVVVPVDGMDDVALRQSVMTAVQPLVGDDRRAAFVLTFGAAGSPSAGTAIARRVNAIVDSAAPSLFTGAARRDFWKALGPTAPPAGSASVELYLVQK